MKNIFMMSICCLFIIGCASANQSAVVEIGDLSPQIKSNRSAVVQTTKKSKPLIIPNVMEPTQTKARVETKKVKTVAQTQNIQKTGKQVPTSVQTSVQARPQTTVQSERRTGNELVFAKNLKVLTKGEPIPYPLPEGAIIQCYAKKIDGSIDAFEEYNDNFIVQNGDLYSNTLHKLYKPEKAGELKKVDNVGLSDGGTKLKMYDPLWEKNLRHHKRHVTIDLRTGAYFMTGTQDNAMWYRKITTAGYCRALKP